MERELAMGAVAEGSVEVLDLSLINLLGLSEKDIHDVSVAARKELEFRKSSYRGGRPSLALDGKTVILVDDGIATGCRVLAAIAAARRNGGRASRGCGSGRSSIRLQCDPDGSRRSH
ncbi:MAG: hypothetical protein WB952_02885 [Terriglobales bacterium]